MELRDNQKEAIEFIKGKKYTLLEASVGFGKTFTILYFINENPDKKFIILVHKKSMTKQWEEESEKIFGEVLENMRILPYTTDIPKNLFCDCLVIDEFHFLKGLGVRWRNAKKIKWHKTIWLTATPVDVLTDWYAYLKFMEIVPTKEYFYDYFEVYGHNATKPRVFYPRYINYRSTPMFKPDGLNEEKLNYQLSRFRLTLIDNDVLKNIKHTHLKCSNAWPNGLSYYERRVLLHEDTKNEKLKHIQDMGKSIVIVSYDIEKEWLKENLSDEFWIMNYKEAQLTGTDGLQKEYHRMIFWTPISSKLRLVQAIGRIDRQGQEKKVEIITFISNNYEQKLWKKTLTK